MRQGLVLVAGALLAGMVVALFWIGLGLLVLFALPVFSVLFVASLVARALGRPLGLSGVLRGRVDTSARDVAAGESPRRRPGGHQAGGRLAGRIIEGECVERGQDAR